MAKGLSAASSIGVRRFSFRTFMKKVMFLLLLVGCTPQLDPVYQPPPSSFTNSRSNGRCVVNLVSVYGEPASMIEDQIRRTCAVGDILTFNDMIAGMNHWPAPSTGMAAEICDMKQNILRSSGTLSCVFSP
jgi:hypothetical protein